MNVLQIRSIERYQIFTVPQIASQSHSNSVNKAPVFVLIFSTTRTPTPGWVGEYTDVVSMSNASTT